ncbi:uncharacterized protein LOC132631460 isoform X2 [Lycium barbarum]|uniref:uncharacterized protein LOC132631460 isoform X2 n=1 Tax=Lycium barbarum TaxID=112863 RepID=UPI00293E57EE|nr:uncharacterized protein LOC132631460 isoform X2 [Lycium barbarum]
MAGMALKITTTINSNLNTNGVFSPPPNKLHSHLLPSNKKISGRRILRNTPLSLKQSKRSSHGPLGVSNLSQSKSFDVVIIGAGIIGLTIARQLLLDSDLSVALVDAALPCSGATGAGQGYIWKAHKSPGTEKWELIMRSHQLWESLAESIQLQGMDPLEELGWKKTGSLLVSKTADESATLKKRVEELSQEGLRAEFLSTNDLLSEEPQLVLEKGGGAAFFPDDYQLDAHRTVAFIEKGNRRFAAEGRYAEFYHDPAIGLVRPGNSCEVGAIQTSKNTLQSKKAVVIAAGCWTGSLMHDLIKQPDIELDLPIKPRKGHLLVLENFKSFKLNHGIMEAGYANHQSATLKATASDSGPVYNAQDLSVSMTATMDALGNLVLGSSRQLVGLDTEVDESVINHIWQRVGEFLPALRQQSLEDLRQSREVRVGLRPYSSRNS